MHTESKSVRRGFAAVPKAQHLRVSAKGGRAKVPKGFATLSPEARSKVARDAANTMWEKRRRENTEREAINPAGDGRPKG